MFLLAGKVLSKHREPNLEQKSLDVAKAAMEAEFLSCQNDPSPTNKALNGGIDDLDIPYIDDEIDEDSITAWWHKNSNNNNN